MDEDLRRIFMEEARDIVERVHRALESFAIAVNRRERLDEIFRGVHTIKGGAGACGMGALKDVAHALEADLVRYKSDPDAVSAAEVDAIQRGIDRLETMIEGGVDDAAPAPVATEEAFGFFDEPAAPASRTEADVPAAAPVSTPFATPASAPAGGDVIRVSLDRIQRNFDIISEIFLTRNQMRYLVEQRAARAIGDEEFYPAFEVLDASLRKNIGELEYVAMSMRMMSAKSLMKRMEKTVRSYSAETGKAIKVEIEGEDTELDKKILDSLAEPLIHLTRNAMDHGIEPEADRRRSGKPPVATIRFEAALSGNEVVVRVTDDGRGIDETKVLASAKKRGVDVSGVKTKDEAIALIFLPGLSTKEQTSDISGRGVGMDAVKSYVESFGGSISIQTELGKGTTFTLRLPIGMSVIPAVIARANDELFALSTSGLVETRTISSDAIVRNGDELYYERNGQFIPCYDIEDYVFESQRRPRMPSRQASLCVCETAKGLVAVRVQELISNIEIVVKSPPKPGRQAPYVTGVSILATGRPIFVISLGLLYERAIRPRLSSAEAARRSHAAA